MKVCGSCKKEKSREEFHVNPTKPDGLQSMCKECRKAYHRKHYLANKAKYKNQSDKRKKDLREEFNEYKKTLCCSKCGENRWYVLDFHHRNPKEKDTEVSYMIGSGRSIESIKKEIEKCDVLCANCHREIHYIENARMA